MHTVYLRAALILAPLAMLLASTNIVVAAPAPLMPAIVAAEHRPADLGPTFFDEPSLLEAELEESDDVAMAAMEMAGVCLWFGKAPFCNGKCDVGYTLVDTDKKGDGKTCTTGTKAKCCKTSEVIIRGTAPFCNGKCNVGEEYLGESEYGPNGNKCTTGKAAVCGIPVD